MSEREVISVSLPSEEESTKALMSYFSSFDDKSFYVSEYAKYLLGSKVYFADSLEDLRKVIESKEQMYCGYLQKYKPDSKKKFVVNGRAYYYVFPSFVKNENDKTVISERDLNLFLNRFLAIKEEERLLENI